MLILILSIAPVALQGAPAASALQSGRPLGLPVTGHLQTRQFSAPMRALRHKRHRRHPVCPIDWRRGPAYVERLIRCAAQHWHVPGGAPIAVYIAWRESHFMPNAYNPSGAEGIYQHMRQYWPGRAALYGFPRYSAFNARANIIVTMRMVRAMGNWAPWGMSG